MATASPGAAADTRSWWTACPTTPRSTRRARDGDSGEQVMESCDGRDNDCDGKIDEDQRCDTMRSCTADGECAMGLQCDTESGQCVAPSNSGSLCKTDAQCAEGFCISAGAIGLEGLVSDKLCATACCKDADCPEESRVRAIRHRRARVPAGRDRRAPRHAGRQDAARCRPTARPVCASAPLHRHVQPRHRLRHRRHAGSTSRVAACLTGAGSFVCGEPARPRRYQRPVHAFDPISCKSALCCGQPLRAAVCR